MTAAPYAGVRLVELHPQPGSQWTHSEWWIRAGDVTVTGTEPLGPDTAPVGTVLRWTGRPKARSGWWIVASYLDTPVVPGGVPRRLVRLLRPDFVEQLATRRGTQLCRPRTAEPGGLSWADLVAVAEFVEFIAARETALTAAALPPAAATGT